jgi:hypothetical protein
LKLEVILFYKLLTREKELDRDRKFSGGKLESMSNFFPCTLKNNIYSNCSVEFPIILSVNADLAWNIKVQIN